MTLIDLATIPVGITNRVRKIIYFIYNKTAQKSRLKKIRTKEVIDVAFLLYNLSKWKTEELYLKMTEHPTFNPVIVCTLPNIGYNITAKSAIKGYNQLTEYLKEKEYNYCEASNFGDFKADIVLFQEPYDNLFPEGFNIIYCKRIFGYIPYGFHISSDTKSRHSWYTLNCTFIFESNSLICKDISRSRNFYPRPYATGLPFSDLLMKPASEFDNPWKPQNKAKKRVIWAPHFSIGTGADKIWLNLSSFISMYEWMPNSPSYSVMKCNLLSNRILIFMQLYVSNGGLSKLRLITHFGQICPIPSYAMGNILAFLSTVTP